MAEATLCFECRKKHKRKGLLFCKACEDKPRSKTTWRLIIYDKMDKPPEVSSSTQDGIIKKW
jgi:hypothetical protein